MTHLNNLSACCCQNIKTMLDYNRKPDDERVNTYVIEVSSPSRFRGDACEEGGCVPSPRICLLCPPATFQFRLLLPFVISGVLLKMPLVAQLCFTPHLFDHERPKC